MYQIMCDDYILHDAVIDDLKVIGARCGLEVNKTGSLKSLSITCESSCRRISRDIHMALVNIPLVTFVCTPTP